jgi:hypothetical protein
MHAQGNQTSDAKAMDRSNLGWRGAHPDLTTKAGAPSSLFSGEGVGSHQARPPDRV